MEQARRTPEALAVDDDSPWTFADLDKRSSQLAHRLRRLGIGPDDLVAICMHRSPHALVAILGILKAGAAYVPFDPTYPQERLSYMLEQARPKALVCSSRENAS